MVDWGMVLYLMALLYPHYYPQLMAATLSGHSCWIKALILPGAVVIVSPGHCPNYLFHF